MPRIAYVDMSFRGSSLEVIERADEICQRYAAAGYDLTLRQLYYQFVSRGWLPNRQSEYKRLGDIVSNARLAGMLDWDHIVDRTRNLRDLAHWESPASIVDAVAAQYREDKWAGQEYRVEAWIEKDALIGVLERACTALDVPYFSCRGYTSQSELWSAARRLMRYRRQGQEPVILHLGDHDPSGIDMTRDISDRLSLFMEGRGPQVDRLALNMDQVERYGPPPNPAKLTDSRAGGYIELHGESSWELDALDPPVITELVEDAVALRRDEAAWREAEEVESARRETLQLISDRFEEVAAMVGGAA